MEPTTQEIEPATVPDSVPATVTDTGTVPTQDHEQLQQIIDLLTSIHNQLHNAGGYAMNVIPFVVGLLIGLVAMKLLMEASTRW